MTGPSSTPKLDLNEQHFWFPGPRDGLPLFLRFLAAKPSGAKPRRAVIYVHGATFPSALSIAHPRWASLAEYAPVVTLVGVINGASELIPGQVVEFEATFDETRRKYQATDVRVI